MTDMREVTEGLPEAVRDDIMRAYRSEGGSFAAFGEPQKRAMAQAVFIVEDALEHRQGKLEPRKRAVVNELRRRRNLLLDDLGENEVPKGRWGTGRWVTT